MWGDRRLGVYEPDRAMGQVDRPGADGEEGHGGCMHESKLLLELAL